MIKIGKNGPKKMFSVPARRAKPTTHTLSSKTTIFKRKIDILTVSCSKITCLYRNENISDYSSRRLIPFLDNPHTL
uniref:Uncharacterized protein n=1 Tax=Romanomermis culicivorax TaxID=13658 RepID=A0A915IU96_ROMCU